MCSCSVIGDRFPKERQFMKVLRVKKYLKYVILSAVLIYLLFLIIPYVSHKAVSEELKQSFSAASCYGTAAGEERVAYVADNEEALICRLRMIHTAKKEIILSTFDFNADTSGKEMLSALLEASERGVSVKVLIDGLSGFLDVRGNPYFQALALSDNAQIRIYNPVNGLKPWKFQARLHDKYVIADGVRYLLGGRNTDDLFLGNYSKSQNIDRELFVCTESGAAGRSVCQLLDYFDEIWNLEDSKTFQPGHWNSKKEKARSELEDTYRLLTERFPEVYEEKPDWTAETMPVNKITLLSNPVEAENKEPKLWYCAGELMKTGTEITIQTPYIICGPEMYQDLTEICQGRQVGIITNAVENGANPWGCTDYLNQKKKILHTGVTVYEFVGTHSSHTKTILIDDRMSLVGSYNLDMRSTYQDTELMLAVDSEELNAVLRKEAEADMASSRMVRKGEEPVSGEAFHEKSMGIGKKILYSVLRIVTLPIRRFL